jgi:hypothetical protein
MPSGSGPSAGSLPVEANPKIELAINMKVAKALRLTIAAQMLTRTNRVIE